MNQAKDFYGINCCVALLYIRNIFQQTAGAIIICFSIQASLSAAEMLKTNILQINRKSAI